MEMIKKRIRTISVYYSSFASALKYLQSNKEEIDKLIGTSYALEDFTSAFQKEEGDENKKHYFMF